MPSVEIPGHTLEFPEGTSEAVIRNAIYDNFPELRPKDYEAQVKARLGLDQQDQTLPGDITTDQGEVVSSPIREQMEKPVVRIPEKARSLLGRAILNSLGPVGQVLGLTTTGQQMSAGIGDTLAGMIEGASSPAGAATLAAAPLQPQAILPDLLQMVRSGGQKIFGGEDVKTVSSGVTETLIGGLGVSGITALPRARAELARSVESPPTTPPRLPITDESRLLPAPSIKMPEFTESTLGVKRQPLLPGPGETSGTTLLGHEPRLAEILEAQEFLKRTDAVRDVVGPERQLPAPRTPLPEFTESTLEGVSPRIPPALPAPGETLRPSISTQTGETVVAAPGEPLSTTTLREPINLPESPVGPRTEGYRIQVPPFEERPIMEQARPITLEDAKALRGAIDIGEAIETPGQPYKAPVIKTDLRQLEKVMQKNTVSTLEAWADDVIREKLGGSSANPYFDPEFLAAATVKGAVLVKRGVTNFADWSKPMVEQFGRGIQPHLEELYKSASAMAKVAGVEKPVVTGPPPVPANESIPLPPTDNPAAPEAAQARSNVEQSIWSRLFNKHFEYTTPKEVFASTTPVEAPVLDALSTAIKDSKPARRETEALREKERSIRAARQAAIQGTAPGRAGIGPLKGALKGELPRMDLEPFADKLDSAQQDALYNHIYGHDLLAGNAYQKSNLVIALQDLMENGKLPQPSQIAWFERIFGPQVASALMGKQRTASRSLRLLAELANIPRAAKTGYDLSATLKQGFSTGIAHPEIASRAMEAQLKAFANRDYALAVDKSFRQGERARIRDAAGLELPSIEGLAEKTREENFTSRIIQNLQNIRPKTKLAKTIYNPLYYYAKGLAGSERAYVTYLNWLRTNVFDAVDATLRDTMPEEALPAKRHQLAMLINAATGRGNVPSNALLNAFFFSPKFTASRFEYPARTAKVAATDRTAVGMEARRQLVFQAAAWTGLFTLLSLGSAAFGWTVKFGHDPRDPDFLKVRLDDRTTIDFGAGYGQAIRMAAQFLSGQAVEPKTGKVKKTDRAGAVGRFLRYKLAPVPSEVWSLAEGKTPDGKPITIPRMAKDLFAPITFENAMDIWNEFGPAGTPLILPDVLGANVSVYEPAEKRKTSILNP